MTGRVGKPDLQGIANSDEVQEALRRAAEAGAEDTRRHVHVRTGRLRDSIEVVKTENGYAYGYGDDVDYWVDQEFGTVHEPANPALRSSLDRVRKVLR